MRHKRNKADRCGWIRSRAFELASSGQFSDWLAIELKIWQESGYPETKSQLDNEHLRNELDRLCEQAKAKQN